MREDWTRATPAVNLDAKAVSSLMDPAFPGASVTEVEPARGGLSNTNLRVGLSGHSEPVLLRLYQRDTTQARKEMAVIEMVASRVSVPRLLYFSDDNAVTGGPYAILKWIDGARLQAVAPRLGREELAQLGRSIGRTLGAIHGFLFDSPGFLDAALQVVEPVDFGRDGHLAYLRRCLITGRGGARLGQGLTSELLAFVERDGGLLDDWLDAPCLTHADFNGSNILVRQRPSDGGWEVAAVLDWEFAFSGSPAFDFGNLLRPPLGEAQGFADATAAGYRQAGRTLPSDWRRIARIADLAAWAEFLDRPDEGAARIDDAREVIRSTIAGPAARP